MKKLLLIAAFCVMAANTTTYNGLNKGFEVRLTDDIGIGYEIVGTPGLFYTVDGYPYTTFDAVLFEE